MTKAIPEWAGMFSSRRSSASSPPADAPTPMIGKFNELGTIPDSSRSGEAGDEDLVMGNPAPKTSIIAQIRGLRGGRAADGAAALTTARVGTSLSGGRSDFLQA